MNWSELKEKVYNWDGSLLDIYVFNTTIEDWKIWVDYVNSNYRIEWYNGVSGKLESQINYGVVKSYIEGEHDLCSSVKVFIEQIQISSHFFDVKEIENDIDPREFNSIEDRNQLVKYMTDLSNLLQKEILLTPDNSHEVVLFRVKGSFVN